MRVFGLIGRTLGHSFSPGFFEEKFLRENLPGYTYRLFPLEKISDIVELIRDNPEIEGLNVTIPYKQEVIRYLDDISPDARYIGAVNTIKIIRNQKSIHLSGYNTDAFGFQHACHSLQSRHETLVLGTGGSAKAVCYVLELFGIPYLSVSRNPKYPEIIGYHDLSKYLMDQHRLIINTTPLGMHPITNSFPSIPYHHLTEKHFLFDLIYNPTETEFLKRGKQAGASIQNGELMLELQAEKSWEIWNS
jgi:shikimate dehydrogenase